MSIMSQSHNLEEWKERYASYREYRSQYLTVLSVTATGWLIGFGFAFKETETIFPRIIILTFMLLVMGVLAYAHLIARAEIKRLGIRLDELEQEIGIKEFRTTSLLERALKCSSLATLIGFIITLLVLVFVILNGAPKESEDSVSPTLLLEEETSQIEPEPKRDGLDQSELEN